MRNPFNPEMGGFWLDEEEPPCIAERTGRGLYVLALDVCFDIDHSLRALIPALDDAPDSDAVAYHLITNVEAVERWQLAASA